MGCIIIMEHFSKFRKSSIRYAKISLKKRLQLVKEVIENNQLVSKIAKRLCLKLSTAKLIIKRYKQEGTLFEAKAEKAKRMEKQQQSSGKKQNIGTSVAPAQNSPNNQQKTAQNNQSPVFIHQMAYFQYYCGTPFAYQLPGHQNVIFYPI